MDFIYRASIRYGFDSQGNMFDKTTESYMTWFCFIGQGFNNNLRQQFNI